MKISTAVIISLIFIFISDGLMYLSWEGYAATWTAYIMIPLRFTSLLALTYIAIKKKWQHSVPKILFRLFLTLILWNIFTILRGFLFANDYYDWRFLFDTSILFLLIPIVIVIGTNQSYVKNLFSITLKYLFKYGFILIPLALATNIQLYSRLMIPISLFIVFYPFIKPKWRLLILIVAATSILIVPIFRTNIIRIVAGLLIVFSFYFRWLLSLRWLKLIHITLFLTPFILFFLAITNKYNIFKFQETDKKYVTVDNKGQTRNYLEDNRTFLYAEVLFSLQRNGTLLLGEGATGKYKSDYYDFGDKRGRYMSEIGFLNTLLFSGIVGLLILSAFLFIVSYYALYKSNNWLCKMLSLFIASRWLIFFIEEYTLFDLNFFFYWILLGLLSTNAFRSMTDSEIKEFFSQL